MKKFVISAIILLLLGFTFWSLVSSARQRTAEREARIRAANEAKFEEQKITLIEGWTNEEIYQYLEKQGLGTQADYTQAEEGIDASEYVVLADKPAKQSLQGYLFPDTYRVAKNALPANIVALLLDTFEQKFNQASKDSTEAAGYYVLPGYENLKLKNRTAPGLTAFEVITLASIVEKETGRAGENASSARLLTERQTVAGVFLNRLEAGMALQSDASINYITKSGRASSTAKDLEIDSPYNTYKYPGLPPGPIANVSYSSLYAALHPIETDNLYFLHAQPSGEIYYAKTLDEHNSNRAKYLK